MLSWGIGVISTLSRGGRREPRDRQWELAMEEGDYGAGQRLVSAVDTDDTFMI
jgi:hypothetical protein